MEKKRSGISNLQGLTLAILRRRPQNYDKAKQRSEGEANDQKCRLLSRPGSCLISGMKRIQHRVENSRGVETIKDFLLEGYRRLPKPSSFHLFSCYREPKVHGSRKNHCTFSFDSDGDPNSQADFTPKKDVDVDSCGKKMTGSFLNFGGYHDERPPRQPSLPSSSMAVAAKPRPETARSVIDKKLAKSRAETRFVIEKKLREIVMEGNISLEDAFDIEKFLRSYSHLTSPFYIDMVNQFLMDVCCEFVELLNE